MKCCAYASLVRHAIGSPGLDQDTSHDITSVRFSLAKEIKGAFYRAVSPDGRLMCIGYIAKHPGRIAVAAGSDKMAVSHQGPSGFRVVVVETGSWMEIYSAQVAGLPGSFSFFLDNEAVYGEASTYSPMTCHYMVIDLPGRSLEELQQPYKNTTGIACQALRGRKLACVTADGELQQSEWPEFNVLMGVGDGVRMSGCQLNADRSKLIHLLDQQLVCHRVEDLSILWTREVDPVINLKARMRWSVPPNAPYVSSAHYAISADGRTVALAPAGAVSEDAPRSFYTEILDGETGKPVTRWPLYHHDGIALSANGKLLATGEVADQGVGHVEPTVHVHSVPSCREVATLVHDIMPRSQKLNASLSGGIEFTPDGRYLVTSANSNVKIWKLIH
jgi:hypothetical protein